MSWAMDFWRLKLAFDNIRKKSTGVLIPPVVTYEKKGRN